MGLSVTNRLLYQHEWRGPHPDSVAGPRLHDMSEPRQHAPSTSEAANEPDVPEPSYAERARTLVSMSRLGSLSSLSRRHPGVPFGSIMPYAENEHGEPAFLISTMAMHTQNLLGDPRCSLLASEASEDPLGAGRVTLVGEAKPVADADRGATREPYLDSHPNSRYWVDFKDFEFFKLTVAEVYFVGGFGVMGWVDAEDYRAARPDPLAQHAAGICEHMNEDHEAAMISMAKAYRGIVATDARMSSIDRLGFHMRLETSDGMKSTRLGFDESVETPADARRVLVAMVRAID